MTTERTRRFERLPHTLLLLLGWMTLSSSATVAAEADTTGPLPSLIQPSQLDPLPPRAPMAASSSISIASSCACLVTQGALTEAMTAVRHPFSDVEFYSYNNPAGASANTPLFLELSSHARLFLYESTTTLEVSLFMIYDEPDDVGGGLATMTMAGIPLGATLAVVDDAPNLFDSYSLTPPDALFTNGWSPCCTDGWVIRGVECGGLELTITPAFGFLQGGTITQLDVISGSLGNVIPLPSLTEDVTISCQRR